MKHEQNMNEKQTKTKENLIIKSNSPLLGAKTKENIKDFLKKDRVKDCATKNIFIITTD